MLRGCMLQRTFQMHLIGYPATRRVCPPLRNLSRQELCGRMMALRVALPAADLPAIIRKRPQLLLDEV